MTRNPEELERWYMELPRCAFTCVPQDVLDRVSAGVVARIESRRSRNRRWHNVAQPAVAGLVTFGLIALLVFIAPYQMRQTSPIQSVGSSLVASLAPDLTDSTLHRLTLDDVNGIFDEVAGIATDSISAHTERLVVEQVADEMWIDAELAMTQLTAEDRVAILNALENENEFERSGI